MLRGIAGWLLLIGVVYIPWHDGGVAPASTFVLSGLVTTATILWIWGHFLEGKRPAMPVICIACTVALLLMGWWMTGNALRRYDSLTHSFFPARALWRKLPGSWDALASQTAMLNAGSMLLAMVIACDLGRYAKWRHRFMYAVVLSGALIALAGILQASTSDAVVPGLGVRHGTSFATFAYHGNAGTFLNLCYPMAFALLLQVAHRTKRRSRRVLAALPVGLILVGAIVNVSRAAQAITVLLTVGLAAWTFWLRRGRTDGHTIRRWGWQIAVPVVVLALMIAGAVATTRSRWRHFPEQLSEHNPRLVMWEVCGYWLGDAGPLGYGPGTYKLIYPTTPPALLKELYPRWIVRPYVPGEPVSIWNHVYNDYLQYAFEWGWLGAVLWLVVLFGGIGFALKAGLRKSKVFGDRVIAGGVFFALAGLYIHAAVDCPLQILGLQFYAGILLGLGWGSRYWGRDAAPETVVVTVARVGGALEHAKYN
jgi:hypothetical protein